MEDTSGADRAKLIDAAGFTAHVVQITPAAISSKRYDISFVWNGVTYSATFTSGAGATVAAICTALAGAINTAVGGDTAVDASDDTTHVTLTSEVAGIEILHILGADLPITADNAAYATDALSALAGVSMRDETVTPLSLNAEPVYASRSSMSVMTFGRIPVAPIDVLTMSIPTADVYLQLTGTNKGLFRGSAATGAMLLPKHQFKWFKLFSDRAVLQIKL